MRKLIKDTMILTMDEDKKIIQKGFILIEDNKIKEVGEGKYKGEINNIDIIDGKDSLAMPGLVNCHNHLAMTLLRGYGEGLPLMRWLNEKIWPMENKFKKEHIEIGTKVAFLEMLKTGTTCFNDMYFMQQEVYKVAKEFKIRGVLGLPIIGENWEEQLNSALQLYDILSRDMDNKKLIKTMIAPHSPYTLDLIALKEIAKTSIDNKIPIHTHIAETIEEMSIIKEKYKKTPCELLLECGIFNNKVVGAHCVHLTDEDIEILKENNVSTVYNPQSNMKLASGVSRVCDMLDKGINVCFGTDGASSNNNLNMFEEIETGALLQKLWYKDPTKLPGEVVLEMATVNGGRALGFSNLGRIKEGFLADIILIDINSINLLPIHHIYSNLVFSANGSEVETVIVNGEVVIKNKEFLFIDEERILYDLKKAVSSLF